MVEPADLEKLHDQCAAAKLKEFLYAAGSSGVDI
jgi:hypothetical protein